MKINQLLMSSFKASIATNKRIQRLYNMKVAIAN